MQLNVSVREILFEIKAYRLDGVFLRNKLRSAVEAVESLNG